MVIRHNPDGTVRRSISVLRGRRHVRAHEERELERAAAALRLTRELRGLGRGVTSTGRSRHGGVFTGLGVTRPQVSGGNELANVLRPGAKSQLGGRWRGDERGHAPLFAPQKMTGRRAKKARAKAKAAT